MKNFQPVGLLKRAALIANVLYAEGCLKLTHRYLSAQPKAVGSFISTSLPAPPAPKDHGVLKRIEQATCYCWIDPQPIG